MKDFMQIAGIFFKKPCLLCNKVNQYLHIKITYPFNRRLLPYEKQKEDIFNACQVSMDEEHTKPKNKKLLTELKIFQVLEDCNNHNKANIKAVTETKTMVKKRFVKSVLWS